MLRAPVGSLFQKFGFFMDSPHTFFAINPSFFNKKHCALHCNYGELRNKFLVWNLGTELFIFLLIIAERKSEIEAGCAVIYCTAVDRFSIHGVDERQRTRIWTVELQHQPHSVISLPLFLLPHAPPQFPSVPLFNP